MVVDQASIMNIMGGMESTAGVRLHNHRRKLRQRFDIIKKLGQGTYGKVQLGINKETGQEVAIKTIKKSKIESEADLVRIRREIQIMSSVQHPNIIHIYEVFENREKMVLVMEYAAGGELYDFLSERKVLGEEEARRLFRQIATAVYYCHKHKICHRDLKLENILLDEHGSAKIADFGLSNVFDETRLLGTFCGSPLYASPEIVQGTPYHGPEVDCWSLGVLLYTLVYGAMPFDGSNFKRLVKQISQGDYFEPKKPSPASPLIRDMLTVSPKKRGDIVKICSHWWVNEGHSESCLDIAEHLANQTPVRLDLLLSLAPPMSADKVVVTKNQEDNGEVAGALAMAEGPVRSHSVGSLMELDQPSAERRIRDFVNATKAESSKARGSAEKSAETSKRKLEEGISTEDTSVGGAKKKERSRSKQRSSRSDRRSSSRSRKQGESMDIDPDALPRSDSKELTLAAASAISQSLKDDYVPEKGDVPAEKSEEKRKSVKGLKKKTKPEKEKEELVTSELTVEESSVAEGTSGNEPVQQALIPEDDTKAVQESTKGKVKRKKKVEEESAAAAVEKFSDASPSDESVKSSQSEPSVEEVKVDVNGDDTSEGVVSIMSSSTAPVSSFAQSDTGIDLAGLDKTKSQGKLSLGKITPTTTDVAVPVAASPGESSPPRTTERRKSKIFETAEKFNNLANTERKGSIVEKPKKIHIPGVKVSDAKAAFERKSSITSSTTSVPATVERKGSVSSVPAGVKSSLSKKIGTEDKNDAEKEKKKSVGKSESKSRVTSPTPSDTSASPLSGKTENAATQESSVPSTPNTSSPDETVRLKKLKDAVEVISNVIGDQVSGRKLSIKKPPKLLSFDGSKPNTPSQPGTPLSPSGVDPITGMKTVRVQVAPNDVRLATIQVSTPQATKYPNEEPPLGERTVQTSEGPSEEPENKPKKAASKMEIILKSATLPRRKTSKAEIQMGVPPPVKASTPERQIKAAPSPGRRASAGQPLGGYRSEVEHLVGGVDHPNRPRHQRSEVSFPVAAASSNSHVHPLPFRSASCEPESTKQKPREHIIPIRFEGDEAPTPRTGTPPAKPPVPPTTSASASGNLPYQRTLSQRSSSLSRQSTQDSDTESTISQTGGEPIRKSPREYIIPIAVEGGGYVTPRAASLEPSEDSSRASTHSLPRSRFGRTKRMSRERHRSKFSSLLSESEDERESPFATLHRHSSVGRDSDNDERPPNLHLHRLRSSRPAQRTLEHTDSMSSAEEEDDDEGFEILTAENLFSSLLSRVRSLTQRLNVEDGGRPGFPSSRLLSQFAAHPGSRASPFIFPNSMLSRASPFEPLSRRVSETSRSFSRNDSESGTGGTPWRRSVSRDVSDTDSIYSESLNSGTLPKGRSSGDFSDTSSLSSYSYTPSLAARLAQYQQPEGTSGTPTPTPERRTPRVYMKSRTDEMKPSSTSRRLNSQNSFSSARRAARALEEELNGLELPSSYIPMSSPSSSIPVSRTNDDIDPTALSSSSRRLGRTLSMRERSSSPSTRRDYLLPASRTNFGLSDSSNDTNRSRHLRQGHGSSSSDTGDCDHSWDRSSSLSTRSFTGKDRRRPYNSSLSDSGAGDFRRNLYDEKDLPPLPFLPRRTSRDSFKYTENSITERRKPDHNEEDCTYYEILPYHKKDSQNSTLTRSCPPSAFLSNPSASNEGHGSVPSSINIEETSKDKLPEPTESNPSSNTEKCTVQPRHFRSMSVTREIKTPIELKEENQISSVKMRRSCSSARTTPDRSILSKFFRHSTSDVKHLSKDERSEAEGMGEDGEKKSKPRRISRFLRPDFFDTPREESIYAKEKDLLKASKSEKIDMSADSYDKKQTTGVKTSSRFLQSLEKKLEKLRGGSYESGKNPPSSESEHPLSGRRIESTIRSLREKSLGPRDSDSLPTESLLLKRAVSVSDFSPSEKQANKKIGDKVLGLFRKSNESQKKSNDLISQTESSKIMIPTFRRMQKPYAGSHSDTILLHSVVNGEASSDNKAYVSLPEDKTLTEVKPSKSPELATTHSTSNTKSGDSKTDDGGNAGTKSLQTDVHTSALSCSTSSVTSPKLPEENRKKSLDKDDACEIITLKPKDKPKSNEVIKITDGKTDKPSLAITTPKSANSLPNSSLTKIDMTGESSKEDVIKPSKSLSKVKSEKGLLASKSKSKVPKLLKKDGGSKVTEKEVSSGIPKDDKTVRGLTESSPKALIQDSSDESKSNGIPPTNKTKMMDAAEVDVLAQNGKGQCAKSDGLSELTPPECLHKSISKSKLPKEDKEDQSTVNFSAKVTATKDSKDEGDRFASSSPTKSVTKRREPKDEDKIPRKGSSSPTKSSKNKEGKDEEKLSEITCSTSKLDDDKNVSSIKNISIKSKSKENRTDDQPLVKKKEEKTDDKVHDNTPVATPEVNNKSAISSSTTTKPCAKSKELRDDRKTNYVTTTKDEERAVQNAPKSSNKSVSKSKLKQADVVNEVTPSLPPKEDDKEVRDSSRSPTKSLSKGRDMKQEDKVKETPLSTKGDEKVAHSSRSPVKSVSKLTDVKDVSPFKKNVKTNSISSPSITKISPPRMSHESSVDRKLTKISPPRISRESSVDRRLSSENSQEKSARTCSRSPPKPVTKPVTGGLLSKQQGIPRRVPVTQPGLLHRSSSQSRSPSHDSSNDRRNSASGSEANIPVVSLKDVERRHRAMLMDKWSKSLQSLHTEKKEATPELNTTNTTSESNNSEQGKLLETSPQMHSPEMNAPNLCENPRKSENQIEATKSTAVTAQVSRPGASTKTTQDSPKTTKNTAVTSQVLKPESSSKTTANTASSTRISEEVSASDTQGKSSSLPVPPTNHSKETLDGLVLSPKLSVVKDKSVGITSGQKPRPSLHLDLVPRPSSLRVGQRGTDVLTEDSLLSPTESESVDSWSVCSGDCSDLRDWPAVSPTLSLHSPTTEDTESVSDRIRRKSFYCRFNDIKKKKKPSSSLGLSSSAGGSSYGLSPRSHAYPLDFARSVSSSSASPALVHSDKPRRSKSLLVGNQNSEELSPLSKNKHTTSPTSASYLIPGHSRTSGMMLQHHNGGGESPFTIPTDRSPSWERSGMGIKNDLLFHNLGLHRFDPTNLSVNKETLFELLSPTCLHPNQKRDCSPSSSAGESSTVGSDPIASDTISTAPKPESTAASQVDTPTGEPT